MVKIHALVFLLTLASSSPLRLGTMTKQIVTIGPQSKNYNTLKQLHESGADIFRINFSHGDASEKRRLIGDLHEIRKKSQFPLEIMADLQGPKFRIGKIIAPLHLKKGHSLWLDSNIKVNKGINIPFKHDGILKQLQLDDELHIDDGKVKVCVTEKYNNGCVGVCVVNEGTISSNKGVNIPNGNIYTDPITQKDLEDIRLINSLDKITRIDYVALSYVTNACDLERLRSLVENNSTDIIAKIERPKAIENIDSILDSSDGIMIARGDLGIEAGLEKIPILQLKLNQEARKKGKMSIVATGMMESMIENIIPSRAEVTDIATAVAQGATAVMLSGETAVGKFPVETVKMQRKIIAETERYKFKNKLRLFHH